MVHQDPDWVRDLSASGSFLTGTTSTRPSAGGVSKVNSEQMHDRLRAQWRDWEDRDAAPSAAVLESQSTRSSPQGGGSGFDAGKKVKGRKRSLIVDTLGLLLAVSISATSVQDRDAAEDAVA